jgi:hypothetical protein
MRPGLFDRFVASGPELLANINELVLRLNALFDEGNRDRVGNNPDRADRLLGAMDRLSVQLEQRDRPQRPGFLDDRSMPSRDLLSEAGGSLKVDGDVDGRARGVA